MTLYSRLAAYYPCDNTHGRSLSEDVVGTNDGTAGVVSAATGKVRQGMFFLASGEQFRSVPNDSALQALKGLCCWVKFSTLAADQSIISKGSDATDANTSIKLWYDHSDTDLAFTVGDSSTATTVRTDGLTLAVDTWYHIRCFNDGNRMGIAVDGTLYGSGTARAPLTETGLLYLGRDFGGNYFDGVLDEVALFSTAPTIADGAALYNGGDGATLPLPDTLPGPSGKAGAGTRWLPPTFAESDDAVAYLAHGKIPVQRFDGTLERAGVEAPDQKVTVKSSGSGSLTGKRFAYLRFLDADGRVSNVSPLSDVHDTFGSVGPAITGATNASPIVITSASHGLTTGDTVRVTGQLGNTAANGVWTVTSLAANTFSLNGSVGNGDWTASEPPSLRVDVLREGSVGTNQVQTLSYSNTPTAGSFTLSFKGETTTTLTYDDTAADIQSALEALSTVGEDNVLCAGGALPTDVTVTMQNALGNRDQPLLVVAFEGAPSTVSASETTKGTAGTNEIQTLDLLNTPTGGTFTATFDGQTTGNIAYNASATTVHTALEALSNITASDLTEGGGSLPGTAVTIEFGGSLAQTDVAEMTIDPTNLTGGPSIAISTPTPGVARSGGNIDDASYMSKSFTPGQGGGEIGFSSDGTKMYLGHASRRVYQYTLSVAWDVTTASYDSVLLYVGTEDLGPASFQFRTNGETLYICGTQNDKVYQYTLSTAWDLSTASYASKSASVSSETGFPIGLDFSADGTKMYVADFSTNRKVFQYTLSTAWDVSTASYASKSLDTSSETSSIEGMKLSADGTKLYAMDASAATTYQYTLSTPWDLSTGSYASRSYDNSSEDTSTTGFAMNGDETLWYVRGSANGKIFQYEIGPGTDEIQRITVTGTPSEGNFKLTWDGETTGDIDYDATAAEVQTAFVAMSNVGTGNATASGGPLPGSVVDVTFTGNLGSTNVAEMTVDYDGLLAKVTTTTAGSKAVNEIQTLTTDVPPGQGTFTLTFGGQTTDSLPWNATAAQVQTKLIALSTVGTGNVKCTGGPISVADILVEFTGTNSLTDVGAITASSSLTQTSPVLLVDVTTEGLVGTNEVQQVSATNVSGGTYTLSYSSSATAAIQFDATPSDVEQALEAVSTVGNGNVDVTGDPLNAGKLRVEFIGSLGKTNVSKMTTGASSLLSGGWASGASKITYTDVDIPNNLNVTRRQILRTKPGAANVFYIDVDEEDVVSNTFSSTKTDDDLTPDLAVVMLDSNGVDTNLSRHGEPPNWKRSVASFQNRLFYGVDYVERSLVTVSGDTATGIATDWPNVFDDRTLYQDSGKAVAAINADAQTAALSESTATAQTAAQATLRQAEPDSQRIYHSWVTATDSFPESVHPGQTFQVSRDTLDGEMTGQFSFDGRLHVAFEHAIYQYAFNFDPASAPNGDGRMQKISTRGTVNSQCKAFSDDLVYLLDREGCYAFDGDSIQSVSEVIKPIFTGDNATRINWNYQQWFHMAYFPQQRVVRMFVVLDGGPYPRHALCHNVDQQYWWVEEYPWPITSSTRGSLKGKSHVFLGSTGRRIFTLDGALEGIASTASTLRGTVTSSDHVSLTDSAAAFTSDLVGLAVRIVDGTGFGQQRIVTAVTATSLTVKHPWMTRPSTDSVYQVAGVSWSVKTGMLKYEIANENNPRSVEVLWEPVTNAQQLSYRVYHDWRAVAEKARLSFSGDMSDGVEATAGSDRFEVDMTGKGHAELAIGGLRQEGVTGDQYVAVELQGTTHKERHRLHGIVVSGAE